MIINWLNKLWDWLCSLWSKKNKSSNIEQKKESNFGEYITFTLKIDNGVIPPKAFERCDQLTSVIIPEGVTVIGKYAFSECTGLTSVSIPKSVTSIGRYAFEGCEHLKSVALLGSIETIPRKAFHQCKELSSVTVPDNVKTIGSHAFAGCSALTSVNIPDSVETINHHAFAYCDKLAEFEIAGRVIVGNDLFLKNENTSDREGPVQLSDEEDEDRLMGDDNNKAPRNKNIPW